MTQAEQMVQLRKNLMRKYSTDPCGFIETFVQIECVGHGPLIQPFKLWDAQKQAIQAILGSRLNVILKARQLGITWLVLALSAWKLLTSDGFRIGAISRAETEAMELVRRLGVILASMPEWIQPEKTAPVGWTGSTYSQKALEITIHHRDGNDSVFKAFLSNASSGRGFTFNWLIMDEWAFHPWAEELWASLFPTVNQKDADVKMIGLSTIVRGSLFESIYTSPDNGFNKIFIPWSADPSRDDEWYRKTLGALGAEKTLQEYPATVEEALMVPGGQMFPEIKKETHEVEHDPAWWAETVDRYVAFDYGLDMFACYWFAVDKNGKARVYREFCQPNLTIPAACDAYKSLLEDGEKIRMILAPSDLWNRDQVHGRSRALIFQENGMNLTKVSRDFEGGVAAMKQWLAVGEDGKASLLFEENAAPIAFKHLQKILVDPKKPNVYAKIPHDLTHSCDAIRYFAIWYVAPAVKEIEPKERNWTADMLEDYENANAEMRKLIEATYGKPY